MPLTIEEIESHEARLRAEMANIQRLLDAYTVFRNQALNGPAATAQLPFVIPSIVPESAAPSSPVAPPTPAPPYQPYVNPELKAMSSAYNSKGAYVDWALRRMTGDFSLRDIQALLEREGIKLRSPDISCVLTRLKTRGQITQIKPGSGRTPAIFRGPENATKPDADEAEPAGSTETADGSDEMVT